MLVWFGVDARWHGMSLSLSLSLSLCFDLGSNAPNSMTSQDVRMD